jgi:hypothetical protein
MIFISALYFTSASPEETIQFNDGFFEAEEYAEEHADIEISGVLTAKYLNETGEEFEIPVANCEIEVDGYRTATDAEGKYTALVAYGSEDPDISVYYEGETVGTVEALPQENASVEIDESDVIKENCFFGFFPSSGHVSFMSIWNYPQHNNYQSSTVNTPAPTVAQTPQPTQAPTAQPTQAPTADQGSSNSYWPQHNQQQQQYYYYPPFPGPYHH